VDLFFEAVQFATKAHHAQRRKSSTDPYIVHPMRVAYLAIDAGLSENAVCAAVLHDVVEDTDVEIAEITAAFPLATAKAVLALTKWWSDDLTPEDKSRYMSAYYQGILANQDAINIKLLDRIDNLRDMLLLLPKQTRWVEKYMNKTDNEFGPIYAASDNRMIQELFQGTKLLVRTRLASL
jgi:(p)ppGpp synthase/HD superfamily hydrolase